MEYVEQNCVITHEGREFESGGAVVTPYYVIAYVKDVLNNIVTLTDWHGNELGHGRVKAYWATPRSYISSRCYQIDGTINGVTYTGRSAGVGMIWKGKRKAQQ
jgi:hypothetical protein